MHDTILIYSKPGAPRIFSTLYQEPTAATTKSTKGKKMKAIFSPDGKRTNTITDEASPGPPLNDVWNLPILAPGCKERKATNNYPTQKPTALLERLILSLSNEGGLVVDAFAGSGTSGAAAFKHGRKAILIDQGTPAIETMESRLGIKKQSTKE
jgi:DNA modification methylase